jgi:hypothetical protein
MRMTVSEARRETTAGSSHILISFGRIDGDPSKDNSAD